MFKLFFSNYKNIHNIHIFIKEIDFNTFKNSLEYRISQLEGVIKKLMLEL